MTGLTGLLWGGLVRVFLLHHVTYSINSLCHFFGRRRFETDDESRNLLWLSPLSFGESWHNNHHAFPTSFRHGMRLGARHLRRRDLAAREVRAGLGRGADLARAPGPQGGRTRDAVTAPRAGPTAGPTETQRLQRTARQNLADCLSWSVQMLRGKRKRRSGSYCARTDSSRSRLRP